VVSCDLSSVDEPGNPYYDGSLTGSHPAIHAAAATAVEWAGSGAGQRSIVVREDQPTRYEIF